MRLKKVNERILQEIIKYDLKTGITKLSEFVNDSLFCPSKAEDCKLLWESLDYKFVGLKLYIDDFTYVFRCRENRNLIGLYKLNGNYYIETAKYNDIDSNDIFTDLTEVDFKLDAAIMAKKLGLFITAREQDLLEACQNKKLTTEQRIALCASYELLRELTSEDEGEQPCLKL